MGKQTSEAAFEAVIEHVLLAQMSGEGVGRNYLVERSTGSC